MPASTTRGYPYPLDTDPIDVAGDTQRLATAINGDAQANYDYINAVNSQQSTDIATLITWHNQQGAQIGQLYAQTYWLRENINDRVEFTYNWYGSTNANGEVWIISPIGIDITVGFGLAQVADINIGAWLVIGGVAANYVHARMFSPSGPVANLACSFSCQLSGARNIPFP